MQCNICYSEENTRNLDLYVMGSEGFCICHDCEMRLVEHICQMMRLATISRKKGYESLKKVLNKTPNTQSSGPAKRAADF